MASAFSAEVQTIVGPLLTELGFVLDEIDDRPEEGGTREQHVVYYRSEDCKIQIYYSAREGETNCMIAPLDAPNEFGLRSKTKKWQFLQRFVEPPDLPLEQLLPVVMAEFRSYPNALEWVKSRIAMYIEAARAGIAEMYGQP